MVLLAIYAVCGIKKIYYNPSLI